MGIDALQVGFLCGGGLRRAHFWPNSRRLCFVRLVGKFGVPLNHPRFLEWIGVPESASLLEMGPGRWLDALSRDQAMAAAIQLHRDVCLMTTNLDSLDQYDLSLQGTASKMLETSLSCSDFPPRFRSDGGDGTMVALAGSYPSHVGHLNVDYYILV